MSILHPWKSATLAAVLLAVTAVAPAAAHEGNTHYRSEVHAISPAIDGVTVRVLDHDDALELTNHGDRTVVVYGYEHEPFLRFLPDRTVQIDEHSATARAMEEAEAHEHDEDADAASGHAEASTGYMLASYVYAHAGEDDGHEGDESHDASGAGSSNAGSGEAVAAPHWTTLDKTGHYSWHDDRIKWRKTNLPPQVTDQSKATKIRDWSVPIRAGAQAATIQGTLFWVGESGSSGGFPVAAIVSLVVLALLAAGTVVLVRRRRLSADDPAGTSES